MSHPLCYNLLMKMKNKNTKNLHKEAEAKKKAEALKLQEKFAKMSEQEFWDLEKNI